jgi:HAE1 family hydrophobic/amphiphilic exporter-1
MLWRDFYFATDLASAISAIVMLAGSICFFLLPVSQFLDFRPPQAVVSAG